MECRAESDTCTYWKKEKNNKHQINHDQTESMMTNYGNRSETSLEIYYVVNANQSCQSLFYFIDVCKSLECHSKHSQFKPHI